MDACSTSSWLLRPPSGLSYTAFHTRFLKIVSTLSGNVWKFLRPLKMLRFGEGALDGQEVPE